MLSAIHLLTTSPQATHALGQTLARVVRPGDVLGLDGPMGAGKTHLVRGLADGLGMDVRQVSSPTYTIAQEYRAPAHRPSVPPLVHIDAYRLSGSEDVQSAGIDACIDGDAVVICEWTDRLAPFLPAGTIHARLAIEPTGPDERRFRLIAPELWAERDGWHLLAQFADPDVGPDAATDSADGSGAQASIMPTPCPVCGSVRRTASAANLGPFCSSRCRMADLSAWITGRYAIGGRPDTDEDDDADRA
jgi:tRNA threonylcarbamoyladenosine biosynthesis protein TsaE